MADENNPSGQDANGGNQDPAPKPDQNPSPAPDGSGSQVSPEEQARRDEQSRKDREAASNPKGYESEERLSFLEAREMERVRKEHVSEFLTENAKDYPNVKSDDPLFKFAGSKEEVKEIATNLQNRFTTLQQEALSSVREGDDQSLTDEQIAEEEKKLEEDTSATGKSNFTNWMGTLQRRKK